MKILLACLMCLILTISQSFAIKGGPDYGSGNTNTVGTYAGVMTPQSHVTLCCDVLGSLVPCGSPDSNGPCPNQPSGLNSIGVFSLQLPKTGSGSGTVVIFDQGQAYNGKITGSGDPKNGKVSGLIEAHFTFQQQVLSSSEDTTDPNGTIHHKDTFTTQSFSATASGGLNAKAQTKKTSVFATSSIRLRGTADVQFSLSVNTPFDEIVYNVVGFKQSDTTTVTGQ
jgi:hypothetical protein